MSKLKWALAVLIVNSIYIFAFPRPNLFYMGNVVLHLALGLALMVVALRFVKQYPRQCGAFLAAGLPAIYLAIRGNTLDHRAILWLHIGLAVAALFLIIGPKRLAWVVVATGFLFGAASIGNKPAAIRNPTIVPVLVCADDGANGDFAPAPSWSIESGGASGLRIILGGVMR